ncbi:FeoA family protein [Flavobacterium silvaticum]|uniref:Ferrous iron transport protein A n=1 Tax=Flavobacterium silvaticum TaxID=1852020 RepID=A0A972FV86_9FLAO|nr:FeoA family protein [Flavobacterium silvaticum]NMH28250.1 ferrous iron transport protein A [Flavobacterium silvaticum]
MHTTVGQLRKGEKGIITEIDVDLLPLKLLEMGCLPGNTVELLQIAPLGDPVYLDINGARLAIRKETAQLIQIERAPK